MHFSRIYDTNKQKGEKKNYMNTKPVANMESFKSMNKSGNLTSSLKYFLLQGQI